MLDRSGETGAGIAEPERRDVRGRNAGASDGRWRETRRSFGRSGTDDDDDRNGTGSREQLAGARKHVRGAVRSDERFGAIAPETPAFLDPLSVAARDAAYPHWSAASCPRRSPNAFRTTPPPTGYVYIYIYIYIVIKKKIQKIMKKNQKKKIAVSN